jgi:parallel beta-helix repeat protein
LDATSGAAEDSPFVISPDSAAGTKRWILLNDDPIYPQWFGAVGDGVTDDTTNINLAIGAISAGDTLFFPQGTYIVSSALTAIPSNTSVVGAGRNKTIIKIKDNAVAGTDTAFTPMTTADSGTNITFSDFTIDGNQDNQSWVWNENANYLLSIRATNVLVKNCEFKENVANGTGVPVSGSNVVFDGVWSHDHGKKPFYAGAVNNVKVVNCYAYNSTNDAGISFVQGAYDIVISNNHVYGNSTYGIQVGVSTADAKNSRNMVVSGNICYGNETGIGYLDVIGVTSSLYRHPIFSSNIVRNNDYGFYSSYVSGGIFIGNQVHTNNKDGFFLINVRNIQILGNNIANNNQSDSTFSGIRLTDTGSNANTGALGNYIIIGNYIGDYQDTPTQLWGIDGTLTSTAFNAPLVLNNNIFEGNISGAIDDVSALIPALADDATPSVAGGWTSFLTGGTTTITDFDDGYTGQIITVIADHSITITDGTNIFLNGSANFEMTATDTLTLICKSDNKWYEVSRSCRR